MPENIIITPGTGTIEFSDTASTVTTLVIESGSLKFKRGATTYLTFNSTSPTFAVSGSDLKLVTSLINNSGTLIGSTGWKGAVQPTGPTGNQSAQGDDRGY